jgi:RNA polymerase sigma-70 factor (ECF subfamily)
MKTAAVPDEELMLRAGRGDREAFDEIVRRHQDRVLRIALRYAARSEAEDIGQEVFLAVFRAAPRYRPEARFTTWLYRIVVNACLGMRRKRPPPGQIPRREPAEETAQRVREAIARLPDRQRLAVILHRFDGLSYREVAAAMDLSETAVESLLARAYRALRESLIS